MSQSTDSGAAGFKGLPRSHILTKPAGVRVRVTFNGKVIADTRDALELKEGDYPIVYYFPRRDVRMKQLERTAHTTHCPYKGHAAYFSLADGPANAVWTYEQPYAGIPEIKDLLAFYPDKVDSITVG